MSAATTLPDSLAHRAKAAIERLGSALLAAHPNPAQIDADRMFFELRIVLIRILILDRVGSLDRILSHNGWTALLGMDLESELFHEEHDDRNCAHDRVWSRQWIELISREFESQAVDWFGGFVETLRVDASELGAVDESLMGWSARITNDARLELFASDDSARKLGGVYYTPPSLVAYVLDQTLSPAIDACGSDSDMLLNLRVCDPACGCGYFLIEAAHRIAHRIKETTDEDHLVSVLSRCVYGGEINPVTAEVCRWMLWLEARDPSLTLESMRSTIVCADPLVDDAFGVRFDAVVGNPPFLNQLGSGTARSLDRVTRLRDRGLIGDAAYTDEASAFFVLGLQLAAEGGRVCMVQPQSVLATKGGAWMRQRARAMGRLESIWVSNAHLFGDASVYTCAPCVIAGDNAQGTTIERASGAGFETHPAMTLTRDQLTSLETWSPIIAITMGIPEIEIRSSGVIADVATATADFRDEYYGLVGKIVEDSECDDPKQSIRVLTTGLVDLGINHWGRKPTRIHKQKWAAPRVDARAIASDDRLARWVQTRGVEKVLVATQTRIVEAYVDSDGSYVAITPMISVMARDAFDVWKLGAAIGSPVCSAYAMRSYGGSAMHADALKMSAQQVMGLPLPNDACAWSRGAELLMSVQAADANGSDYEERLLRFGREMSSSYGVHGPAQEMLMRWWLGRLGIG